MLFELSQEEEKKFTKWNAKHSLCKGKEGTLGGRLTFSFTPNGIGVITKVKCSICKKELDLTDISTW
jgi:hypothetical protein